jgi:hypothetical protein
MLAAFLVCVSQRVKVAVVTTTVSITTNQTEVDGNGEILKRGKPLASTGF